MTSIRATKSSLAIISLLFAASAAQAQLGATVSNWSVPSSNSGSSSHGIRALADVTNPLPFIGVTPCRIVDTRGPAGTFGGPSLPASTPRSFRLPTGPCAGIPATASAYSLNITVTNTLGPGFIEIYPQGSAAPLVSTLNYLAGQTLANAAIVPAGTSGGVTVVAGVSGTDLIIDINGYYASFPASPGIFQISNNTMSPIILAENTSPSCITTCGILSRISSTPGTGALAFSIAGLALGGSGLSVGVLGSSSSTTGKAVGVFGLDLSNYNPTGFIETAGLLGTSRDSLGVWGQSRNIAVAGQLLNSSDTLVAYGLLGSSFGMAADTTMGPWGVFSAGNFGATGSKHFVEPHPTDPEKVILYSTVEGRTVDTTFRGTARLVDHTAVIEVPEDFRIVTEEEGVTVQITPVGAYSQIYIESQDLNRVVVRGSKDVVFHYQVMGLRRSFKDFQPVQTSNLFMPQSPGERMPAYLTQEARRRLIANGTYNSDGTVNMATAERLGWTKIWADREGSGQDRITRGAEGSQGEMGVVQPNGMRWSYELRPVEAPRVPLRRGEGAAGASRARSKACRG